MLNLNKNKLIPAIEISTSWGEIKGDISKQTDLVELTTDLDTSIKGWVTEQGFLTEHQDLSSYALKSEIPSLTGYATESWVTSQGYVTAETLPEGIATQNWVNEQNYVSDPNNDLSPLFNKKNGYLGYKLIAPGYGETWIKGGSFPNSYGQRYVFNVGNEVYNFAPIQVNGGDGKIYKFNEESGNFEYIATANGDVPSLGNRMWVTPDGVVRYGIKYTVDLQTGQFENWNHSTSQDGYKVKDFYQVYVNSIHNVVLGTNGRPYVVNYNLDRAFVWDYNTNDFTITVPVSGVPDKNYFKYHIYFNGKYIFVWNSVMYEFVEHFDELGEVTSVSFEVVSTPYFPLTTVDNKNVNAVYVYQLQSSTVYLDLKNLTAYQLVDGVWVIIERFTFDEVPGNPTSQGCSFKDYLFGYGYSSSKVGMIPFFHFGPIQEDYGWVDLDSEIKGINNEIGEINGEIRGINDSIVSINSNIMNLDSRIFTLETNYGDALNITNQILG